MGDSTTRYELNSDDGPFVAEVVASGDTFVVNVSGHEYKLKLKPGNSTSTLVAELSDRPVPVDLVVAGPRRVEMVIGGERLVYWRPTEATSTRPASPKTSATLGDRSLVAAPMPGKVIGTLVQAGAEVKAGDPLVILESMKMEVAVRADRDGKVAEILARDGAPVRRGQALVRLARGPS